MLPCLILPIGAPSPLEVLVLRESGATPQSWNGPYVVHVQDQGPPWKTSLK